MFCKITKAILENDIKDFSLHAVTGEPRLPLSLSFPQWVSCETFLAREEEEISHISTSEMLHKISNSWIPDCPPHSWTSLLLCSLLSSESSECWEWSGGCWNIHQQAAVWLLAAWLGGSIRHTPSHCTAINRADISIQLRSGQVRGQRSDQLSELQSCTSIGDTLCQVSPGLARPCCDFLSFFQSEIQFWPTGKTLGLNCSGFARPADDDLVTKTGLRLGQNNN